ncbi:hypothetical protein T440DRAFT_478016 [Plenodomus tracheiphilus IPT5]|uniref:Uncharacterized protein n=1 Tax=Plenodomus tracheiphilus IPT5 TaxID=1408161 RepID=A0A6A7B9C9_9PLEO|nr:hypothetical protein T440DRAFT_478016 [Plenodomus tracheiphilus IPT5]
MQASNIPAILKSSMPFLALPPELRLEIYSALITSCLATGTLPAMTGLLLSCHQIHCEFDASLSKLWRLLRILHNFDLTPAGYGPLKLHNVLCGERRSGVFENMVIEIPYSIIAYRHCICNRGQTMAKIQIKFLHRIVLLAKVVMLQAETEELLEVTRLVEPLRQAKRVWAARVEGEGPEDEDWWIVFDFVDGMVGMRKEVMVDEGW